jgi:hypothetical protein
VLWEAQQRRLLTTDVDPAKLLNVLDTPAGSPEHWGERILQRFLLATAYQVGRRIQVFTDDPATPPDQLVIGNRRALADVSAARARWQHATSPASHGTAPGWSFAHGCVSRTYLPLSSNPPLADLS